MVDITGLCSYHSAVSDLEYNSQEARTSMVRYVLRDPGNGSVSSELGLRGDLGLYWMVV